MLSKPRKRLRRRAAMRRSALNKVGPRTRRRAKATAYLRRTVDPTYCEIRLPGCTLYGTDWAHSLKGSKIRGEQWEEAARSCRKCHDQMDNQGMPHAEMYRLVTEAIARRLNG